MFQTGHQLTSGSNLSATCYALKPLTQSRKIHSLTYCHTHTAVTCSPTFLPPVNTTNISATLSATTSNSTTPTPVEQCTPYWWQGASVFIQNILIFLRFAILFSIVLLVAIVERFTVRSLENDNSKRLACRVSIQSVVVCCLTTKF